MLEDLRKRRRCSEGASGRRLDHLYSTGKPIAGGDRKLDKAYSTMEEAVEKDKSAFCKEMSPVAKQILKDLPPAN